MIRYDTLSIDSLISAQPANVANQPHDEHDRQEEHGEPVGHVPYAGRYLIDHRTWLDGGIAERVRIIPGACGGDSPGDG